MITTPTTLEVVFAIRKELQDRFLSESGVVIAAEEDLLRAVEAAWDRLTYEHEEHWPPYPRRTK